MEFVGRADSQVVGKICVIVFALTRSVSFHFVGAVNVETLRFAVEDGTVTWEVKVTNTGSVPGKDVVQLYSLWASPSACEAVSIISATLF